MLASGILLCECPTIAIIATMILVIAITITTIIVVIVTISGGSGSGTSSTFACRLSARMMVSLGLTVLLARACQSDGTIPMAWMRGAPTATSADACMAGMGLMPAKKEQGPQFLEALASYPNPQKNKIKVCLKLVSSVPFLEDSDLTVALCGAVLGVVDERS